MQFKKKKKITWKIEGNDEITWNLKGSYVVVFSLRYQDVYCGCGESQ